MNRNITRMIAAVAVAAAVGATGASAPGAAGRAPETAGLSARPADRPAAGPGAQLWVKRYTSPGKGFDVARSVAVSPSGKTVFVTGHSAGGASGQDYATVAYDAATGAQLWASRYTGPGNGTDEAHSVAVSPSGRTVFVTGTTSGNDYATVAYSAATGARLWVKRYNGPGNSYDDAAAVTVSPTGTRVLVTGVSTGAASGFDYATVAYDAATGAQLWVSRYNGPGNGTDEARSIAASPGGHTVFVTGSSNRLTSGGDYGIDYATVAYSATTGAQLWVKRYNGPANDYDAAEALALSPGGGTVVITGTSAGTSAGATSLDYATVAYRTRTGARLWVKRYNGPGNDLDGAAALALSPGGGTVFVTGTSIGAGSLFDYATLAYRTRTGARLWLMRYNGPGNGFDVARSVAVSPSGKAVYVTGGSDGATSRRDYTTVAYNAATGRLLWLQRYNGPGNNWDFAFSMAVSPAGKRVFVTGESVGATTHWDYATIAYRG
jgi:WD40 repeat protein